MPHIRRRHPSSAALSADDGFPIRRSFARRAGRGLSLLTALIWGAGFVAAHAAVPVRVIVEVVPLGGGEPDAAIGQAQDAVIAALPRGGVVVVARYRHLPFLALELDPALIPSIAAIEAVASVRPDRAWPEP